MTDFELDLDDEIYEGKLYGWRWFTAIPGLGIIVPPMYHWKRDRWLDRFIPPLELAEDCGHDWNEYSNRVRSGLRNFDLLDWNEADAVPDMPGNPGSFSGFYMFSSYRGAIKYAPSAYCPIGSLEILVPDNMSVPKNVLPFLNQMRCLTNVPVLGFVEASGAIVEHEVGYRAHLLRIVSLYSDGGKRHRETLAEMIGWPGKLDKFRKLRNMRDPLNRELRRLDCD